MVIVVSLTNNLSALVHDLIAVCIFCLYDYCGLKEDRETV